MRQKNIANERYEGKDNVGSRWKIEGIELLISLFMGCVQPGITANFFSFLFAFMCDLGRLERSLAYGVEVA